MQRLVKTLSKFYCKQMAAAAKINTANCRSKCIKSHRMLCEYVQAMTKTSEIFAKFECDRKSLSKSPRCNFGKNHMAATHTSKRKQCTNNRRQSKLKTYEILCGYVRSVALEHLKCCFSFVCDAKGIRAEETTNAHVQVNKV